VTSADSPDFIPPQQRIATFDNDGTLWSEKPLYFQFLFAVDRIKALAPSHPEWKTTQPFKAVLEDDHEALAATGQVGLLKLVMASHAGMSTDEFAVIVKEWLQTARHPRFDRPYTELVYQPMLELLDYLRAHGFKTYIVSGGGVEFLRTFAEEVYGVPPAQVIGSSIKTKFEIHNGRPALIRLPEVNFIDDKAGKPVGIHQHIGQRPLFAAGNSDGDFEMLQWTTMRSGPAFGLVIHHDDAVREWAYDRESPVGRLDRGLDEWQKQGWIMVSMRNDWKMVYPEPKPHTETTR
jgi:hypothetical protein